MALSPKEIEFANNYIVNPNAYQAALNAGYKESTALEASRWINPNETLKNPNKNKFRKELYDYIQEMRKPDEERTNALLTRARKKELLAAFANDPENSVADRMKAIDLDNKMDGEYTNNVNLSGNVSVDPYTELTTEELKKLIRDD